MSASKNIIRCKYMNRMRMLSTIMGVLLTAVFLSSCGAPQVPTAVEEVPPTAVEKVPPTTKAEVPRISVEELKERIDSGEAIVIGDTRTRFSFEQGHIAGAIVITGLTQGEALLDDLPLDLDQEIVLYCA
jgi:hypothetical protein